jgi:hypothetical protein
VTCITDKLTQSNNCERGKGREGEGREVERKEVENKRKEEEVDRK